MRQPKRSCTPNPNGGRLVDLLPAKAQLGPRFVMSNVQQTRERRCFGVLGHCLELEEHVDKVVELVERADLMAASGTVFTILA